MKPRAWPLVLLLSLVSARARADDDEVQIPMVPDQKTETTILPLAGGDSDIGIGGGFLSSIARLDKDFKPYRWRLESVALITFKNSPTGGLDIPFQDYFLKLTVPHLVPNRLRFELRPSFNWLSTIKYYGLGNDSKFGAQDSNLASPRYYEYGRINPAIRSSARLAVDRGVSLLVGVAYTQNWLEVPANSKLADDIRTGSGAVKSLLGDTRPHGVLQFEYGVSLDRRDNEISTKRGMFHEATVRLSPGGTGLFLPYQYGEANLNMRFFVPLGTPRLVLAARGVADFLFGQAPFYELTRFEDTNAIGGGTGVRGVPAQRYYGKVKVFGNLELRTELVDFRLSNKVYKFGVVGLFDAGRLWADYKSHPELDGTGLGLKYGVGGGLRLQSGDSFILRADVAWSPDARPIGAYFGAGQMF